MHDAILLDISDKFQFDTKEVLTTDGRDEEGDDRTLQSAT